MAPWLLFEAGALAKAVSDTFVVPYLIGLSPSDIPAGPLAQFHAKTADRQGTWEVVKAINANLNDKARDTAKLARIFDRWWPDLEVTLTQISSESAQASTPRPVVDMVEEILVTVRSLERRLALGNSSSDIFDWGAILEESISNPTLGNIFAPVNPAVKARLRRLLLAKENEKRANEELLKAIEGTAEDRRQGDSAPNPSAAPDD